MSESRLKPGRLGVSVDGYRVWLLERGYAHGTVEHGLRFLSALGRWMLDEGVAVGQLEAGVVDTFVNTSRAEGRVSSSIARGSRSLLVYLRELEVVGPERDKPLSPLAELIDSYRQWLVERGLAALTVARYEALARRFLGERVRREDGLGVKDLGGEDVAAFLLRECERISVASSKGKVGELRSLLRFADVGAALAEYLTLRGRPDHRRVFLTLRAPTRPIRPDLVGDVVQRACKRAGVRHVGADRLRHALASEMLSRGASLVDIGQVLRHSDLSTTAIYAKVDLGRLRQVAQPWPGAAR